MKRSNIKEWPEDERPREMLLEKGPEALSDAALLAILLRTGRQGQNAIELAREVIEKFGGISGLLSARHEDLRKIKGIGKAKTAHILAAMEIVYVNGVRSCNDTFYLIRYFHGETSSD